jgi:hypothetical protein
MSDVRTSWSPGKTCSAAVLHVYAMTSRLPVGDRCPCDNTAAQWGLPSVNADVTVGCEVSLLLGSPVVDAARCK